jgi:beta-galactosidase
MRKNIIILFLLTCTFLSAQERQVIDMNFDWEFSRDSLFTDSKRIDVPHDFQIEQPWVVPPVRENTGNAIVSSPLAARGFKEWA